MPGPNEVWYAVDGGATVGQRGSEDGIIVLDEEPTNGARITLERGGRHAPFSITCGVYGVMFHTRFLGDEAEGRQSFEAMKPGLASIAAGEAADASKAASAFVTQFP